MTTTIISCVIVAVIAVVITLLIAVPIVRKRAVDKKIRDDAETVGTAEAKARSIIDEALKTAETKKREALLEAKEESLNQRAQSRTAEVRKARPFQGGIRGQEGGRIRAS